MLPWLRPAFRKPKQRYRQRSASGSCRNTSDPGVCVVRYRPPSTHRGRPAVHPACQRPSCGTPPDRTRPAGSCGIVRDTVGLRALHLGPGVVDILDGEVELIFVTIVGTAILGATIGQDPSDMDLVV